MQQLQVSKVKQILKQVSTNIYLYIPAIIIGLLGLYLIFQFILFIGNTGWTHWGWTGYVTKHSPFKCFQSAATIWLSFAKPIMFFVLIKLFAECVKGVSDIYSEIKYAESVYMDMVPAYLISGIAGVALFCMLNNTIFHYIEYWALGILLFWQFIGRHLFVGSASTGTYSGGGGGGRSSDSSWSELQRERKRNQQIREQEENERRAKEEAYRKEEERKANTIIYAVQKTHNNVEIKLENGHTFCKWGTLISSTSSTVTILFNDWYRVYNAKGREQKAWHK